MYNRCLAANGFPRADRKITNHEVLSMNTKGRFAVGVLTALAMMLATFALPRGGPVREAALVQFPMTVGIWAIFVLLFVRLK